MNGQDFIDLANKHIGEPYILGSMAPKTNPAYRGPWDCAEFVTYIVFQKTGKLYGAEKDQTQQINSADAGTIYWGRDLNTSIVKRISVTEARAIPGAILLREAGGGLDGHIVFSVGDGTTVEAHGRADGVVNNKVDGRRWTAGILIPGVNYSSKQNNQQVPEIETLRIGVKNNAEDVKLVQQALYHKGYDIKVDGIFGTGTDKAVRKFQNDVGLTPDGEVGPKTEKALELSF